ncbi:MAG: UvrD-helicase domain-containing protein, partial [Gammaproteobacteria bacterium]|nr:UvrD-helicase domain-containing protein [Gammaproteobacteria bacterium]
MAYQKSNLAKSNQTIADKTALAINPEANIAVFASAGSGKTHLLVHRILKLLLSGVDPSQILAITFTRKAAAEMQERLMKILAEWATADDTQVKTTLQSLSHPNDAASITKTRKLYEELLFSEYEIRITTFHAFCQDILKRFAIHAGVPAGFRVTETNDELKQEARKRLLKAANHENKQLSDALFTLLQHCSTVNNVNEVLDTFINSRSDWLSFTENQNDPVGYAELCLNRLIFPTQTGKNQNPSDLITALHEYLSYISAHKTKTYQSYCELLSAFLVETQPEKEQLDTI